MEPHVVDLRARKKPMHLVASSEGLDLDHIRLCRPWPDADD
jgi:hypothetical protein